MADSVAVPDGESYSQNPLKYLHAHRNAGVMHPKVSTRWLHHTVMRPRDADGMANSVDPDQTASTSTLPRSVCPKLKIITVHF